MNSKRKSHKSNLSRSPHRGEAATADNRQPRQVAGADAVRDAGRRKWLRLISMLMVAVLGTALVIMIVVALTPLDPVVPAGGVDSLEQPQASGQTLTPAQGTLQGAGRGSAQHTTAAPPAAPPRAAPAQVGGETGAAKAAIDWHSREFPEQAEPMDVAKLQQELRKLADTLTAEFVADPTAFHIAAQIYFELKQTKLAEQAWRKCLEQGAQAAGPYAGLAEILAGSGRDQEVIELLTEAHSTGIKSTETYRWLAEAQENLGLLNEALATLDQALAADPKDANAWLARARVLNQLQQHAAAEASVLKNLDLEGDSHSALVVLSTAQARQKKLEQARNTQARLAELSPLPNRAVEDFQGTYETALRNIAVDALVSAASLALENQRQQAAEAHLWRAITLDPHHPQPYMSLAGILRGSGRLNEAFRVQQQLVKIQPENPFNYVNLASVATQVGQIALAKDMLLRAVELDLPGVVVQNSLVHLYLALGDFAEAKRFAKEIVSKYPSVESYLLLASVLEASGETTAAAQALQQARVLDPNHPAWTAP